jgi:hypothetical protein
MIVRMLDRTRAHAAGLHRHPRLIPRLVPPLHPVVTLTHAIKYSFPIL